MWVVVGAAIGGALRWGPGGGRGFQGLGQGLLQSSLQVSLARVPLNPILLLRDAVILTIASSATRHVRVRRTAPVHLLASSVAVPDDKAPRGYHLSC